MSRTSMPRILWLWIPLAVMAVQLILEALLPHSTLARLHSENGPHELLQFLVVAAAFVVAAVTLVKMDRGNKWLVAWVGLAAVCCLYVAGEEVSWGQHFMNWATPEGWTHLNDQNETNLHNTSSWLDQKPRLILLIGVIVGGILMPLARRYKPSWLPARFEMIYPPGYLFVVALLAVLPNEIAGLAEYFDIILFERVSEVQELYLFYFVLLYLLAFKNRVCKL